MIALLISLLIGLSIGIVAWIVYQIFSGIQEEDRTYLDELPGGFKMIWPFVRLFVQYFGPRISREYRIATQHRLKKAGADYSLSPEQFLAAKVIGVFIGFFAGIVVATAIDGGEIMVILLVTLLGYFYPDIWLRELTQQRSKEIFRALPFYLDIITLCVESGSNLVGGFRQAVEKGPDGPLKTEINRMLREMRAGKSRAEALRALADRVDMSAINALASSLIQAEKMGANIAPVLRTNAEQRRTERFQKAEKLAMEAPVKLLGPLVMFIFPNTFIVLIFILMVKAVQENVVTWSPLVWGLSWPG
jgi:tight adherence protein C